MVDNATEYKRARAEIELGRSSGRLMADDKPDGRWHGSPVRDGLPLPQVLHPALSQQPVKTTLGGNPTREGVPHARFAQNARFQRTLRFWRRLVADSHAHSFQRGTWHHHAPCWACSCGHCRCGSRRTGTVRVCPRPWRDASCSAGHPRLRCPRGSAGQVWRRPASRPLPELAPRPRRARAGGWRGRGEHGATTTKFRLLPERLAERLRAG